MADDKLPCSAARDRLLQYKSTCQHAACVSNAQHGAVCSISVAGTAGGEAQQTDIRSLRREIEVKKAKLNELNGETKR